MHDLPGGGVSGFLKNPTRGRKEAPGVKLLRGSMQDSSDQRVAVACASTGPRADIREMMYASTMTQTAHGLVNSLRGLHSSQTVENLDCMP